MSASRRSDRCATSATSSGWATTSGSTACSRKTARRSRRSTATTLAARSRYDDADPGEALAAFRAARASTLRRLESVTAEQLDRRGTFAEYGPLTLRSLVHYLASHDLQHLACMDWLLGQLHGESGVR